MQAALTDTSAGFEILETAVESAGKYTLLSNLALNQVSNRPVAQSIRALAAPESIVNEPQQAGWSSTARSC